MIFPLWNSNSAERSMSSCYPSAKVYSIKDSYFITSLEHISTAEGIKKHCTKVQLIHRNSFLLTCTNFVHSSLPIKSFIIFLFFHFNCPVPIHILHSPIQCIYLPHFHYFFQCKSHKEKLFQLTGTRRIHYSQLIVWVVVMNNQNIWKIVKIEKSNKYKWGRTNHFMNITSIALLLISYEMKITKHLSIWFILNTNVR